MADGKAAAVKTKSFISKKNAQNRPESGTKQLYPLSIAPNPYSGIGVWAFLHFYGGG